MNPCFSDFLAQTIPPSALHLDLGGDSFLKDRLHQKSEAIENNVLVVCEELVF